MCASARFWAGVSAELRNRGVADVCIVCCDGLTGLPDATAWSLARRRSSRRAWSITPTPWLCRYRVARCWRAGVTGAGISA